MRILVLSDIHANLDAFRAVLAAAGTFDALWCLGDVVGYGPDPNECVELLREQPALTCLVGNHDSAALGNLDLNTFNHEARYSARWTQSMLKRENRLFLGSLPERTVVQDVTLAHGSPRSPVWEYLVDLYTALENFSHFETQFCFVGHTHVPVAFTYDGENVRGQLLHDQETPPTDASTRMILNPGSVGQPRDHNPLASFAIFNPETRQWKNHRVEYDIAAVQARMRQANLPSRLVQRLAEGW